MRSVFLLSFMFKDFLVQYGITVWWSFPSCSLRMWLNCHLQPLVSGSKKTVSFIIAPFKVLWILSKIFFVLYFSNFSVLGKRWFHLCLFAWQFVVPLELWHDILMSFANFSDVSSSHIAYAPFFFFFIANTLPTY